MQTHLEILAINRVWWWSFLFDQLRAFSMQCQVKSIFPPRDQDALLLQKRSTQVRIDLQKERTSMKKEPTIIKMITRYNKDTPWTQNNSWKKYGLVITYILQLGYHDATYKLISLFFRAIHSHGVLAWIITASAIPEPWSTEFPSQVLAPFLVSSWKEGKT